MNKNYDPKNEQSILEYAKTIEGKTLNMVIHDTYDTSYKIKNKGALGQTVESAFFGYDINSDKQADFSEVNLELKVVPIKRIKVKANDEMLIKRCGLSVKERIVLSIIDYNEIINETWDDSTIHKKLDKILMMFYYHNNKLDICDREFIISRIWKPLSEDIPYLKKDWETIRDKVVKGKAHELSEGDTLLLGACTKGATKNSVKSQPNSEIPAMQRAYSIKKSYADYIFNFLYSNSTEESKVLPLSIYDEIIEKFMTLSKTSLDKIINDYSLDVNRNAKQFLYLLSSKLFQKFMGVTAKQFNENNISDIEIKTVLLGKNNTVKEGMSFEQINYEEIVESEWIESNFRMKFENKKMIWIVYKTDESYVNQSDLNIRNIYFYNIFYWNMPTKDLDGEVRILWEDTVTKINNRCFSKFKKMSETNVAHIRPKAQNTKDKYLFSDGTSAPKKSFWLNAKYVANQIELNIHNKRIT